MKPLLQSRYVDPPRKRISHILGLLGHALLLPWPAGCKGNRKKWKHLQLPDMSASTHLARSEKAGNIGVALGAVSKGLVTIDIDDDSHVEAFLEARTRWSSTPYAPPLSGRV